LGASRDTGVSILEHVRRYHGLKELVQPGRSTNTTTTSGFDRVGRVSRPSQRSVEEDRFVHFHTSPMPHSITMRGDVARLNDGVITVSLVIGNDITGANRVTLLFDEGAFGGGERIV
jgi:hypothetical protein